MKNKKIYILLLSALLCLAGCRDSRLITDSLNRAEAWMEEHPDSARAALSALSFDEIRQSDNRARYALLYTQMQDKNYMDETNDSLISVAADYYRHTDDVRRRFLSCYYKGKVLFNGGNHLNAMLLFGEAESLCEEVDDDYLLGLLYSQMGTAYKDFYNYTKSLAMFQKAMVCYEQAGKRKHYLYALLDQAGVCRNMDKNEDSYLLLHSVLKEAQKEEDNVLIKLCLGDLIMLCTDMGDVHEADSLYHDFSRNFDISSLSSSFMANIAEIQALKKEWSYSDKLLEQAWQRSKTEKDSVVLYLVDARIHAMKYPQTKAYYSMLEGVKKQNSLIGKSVEQPLFEVQNKLLIAELENQQYKMQTERMERCVVVILLMILFTIVVYGGQKWLRKLYRKRIRELLRKKETGYLFALERLRKEVSIKDESINNLIAEFNHKIAIKDTDFRKVLVNLEAALEEKNKLYNDYVHKVDALLDEKERCLLGLKTLFYECTRLIDKVIRVQNSDFGSDRARENALLDTIDAFTQKIIKSKVFYKDLEEWVNMSNQNVMLRLRSEVKLSDEDSYRQVCYHIAGYSVYGISILMGETKNKIYKRRDRIRKKIEDLNPECMDLLEKGLH